MCLKLLFVGITFFLLQGIVAPLRAETRALLVGVSQYDESIGLASLRGPANDVALLRNVLQARGVSDITMLADRVPGGQTPTRLAILDSLAKLARESRAGDLAFIHLSGHGTRQIDVDGDETDGLDEVFLPSDVTRAAPGAKIIPNALVDDEIGAAVLLIRKTGADVWLVMDSCHSGSGLRAGSHDTAPRFVEPGLLGIVGVPTQSALPTSPMDETAEEPPGQVVAFYAARSSEVAREVNLTPDSSNDTGWYGLFTSRLAARLSSSERLSYRQLFQAVLSDMNDTSVPGGARLQTPSWEGSLVDASVLGGRATVGLRQFAVTGDEVAAGLVHGLGDGSLLALVGDAAAPSDTVLGYAQMEDAEATLAYLRPVDETCEPRSDALCPAVGALPSGVRFARLVAKPLDLVTRFAPPRDLATGLPLAADAAEALALEAAIAEVNENGSARVTIDATRFDIEVAASDGSLWFGRRVAIGQTPVGLSWSPGSPKPLAALLARIAAAEQLATMLGSVAGSGSLLNANPVAIDASVLVSRVADLDPPGQRANPARECRRAQGAMAERAAVQLTETPALKQCDQVNFSIKGDVRGARDVNRVHIDSRFCIHAAYAEVEDAAAATRLGPPMDMCSDCPDGYSAGEERLFVIVTESRDNADQLNLEGVFDNCSGGTPTRGGTERRAADLLTALGRRRDTRGAFGGLDVANVWVDEYRWQVLPKPEVFARAAEAEVLLVRPSAQ